ncbi:MAG TPA: cytochrome P450, partial [Acidimicrobiia bacterium]|nr:cytochrome P450 [Acidimicrobiia bacterium]
RDPATYDEPDEFRPGRVGPAPLSFAYGAHYCLGAALARTEVEVLLDTVVTAWPGLYLVDEHVGWHLRGPFRGVDALVVSLRTPA